ncbi:type II toxin-antitoxin system PemK/MazF family toxin [Patescibacteria group bacterium]|nr:type II toxin-antitoxin system PemK/MazF family toxin [Patescibacteria group bacterium]
MNIAESFIDWTKKKIRYHIKKKKRDIYFYEGQVWWAALGKNIGLEVDGKHEDFHRPVLIVKKYNADMCFVLPLTTQIKNPVVWYQVPVSVGDKKRVINITQGRTISSKRLLNKDGVVPIDEFKKIVEVYIKQFL